MPIENTQTDKEQGGMLSMKDKDIMLRLADVLLSEQLISPDEKIRITNLIQNGKGY